MNSTLKIYKDCQILPEKNFCVDYIETYLATLTGTLTITDFQYVKHELNLVIKIDKSQAYLEYNKDDNFNYCSIQNGSKGRLVYYFIVNKKWISESTLQLALSLDSVNSFISRTGTNVKETIELSDKTKILRQHKGRFITDSDDHLFPNIDIYSEGFTPLLYGEEIGYLEDFTKTSWYLVYMNQNEPSDVLVNPVECYCVPKDTIAITSNVPVDQYTRIDAVWNYLDTANGKCVYIYAQYNPRFRLNYAYAQPSSDYLMYRYENGVATGVEYLVFNSEFEYFCFDKVDSSPIGQYYQLRCRRYRRDGVLLDTYYLMSLLGNEMGWLNFMVAQTGDYSTNAYVLGYYPVATAIRPTDFHPLATYDRIDRTNAKIIKIIEIPYFPTKCVETLGTNIDEIKVMSWQYVFDSWSSVRGVDAIGNAIKLKAQTISFLRTLEFSVDSDTNPFKVLKQFHITTNQYYNANKSPSNEFKLYHSDYYQPKFIYDSFGFACDLELMNQVNTKVKNLTTSNTAEMTYCATSTINSRFLFKMEFYHCNYELQDYNDVLAISRNNEMPIFNQQYINYLRAGYNYDVKSKTKTEIMSFGLATLSLIGAIASFVSTPYTGAAGVAAGISLATSATATYANAIATTVQAENNLQAKQEQLKNQATNVYGADDVDLMNVYAKNLLKLKLYKVSPKMKQMLYQLFFYTGYTANVLGIPDVNTRTRFNFVQAEIVLKKTPNLPVEIVDDLASKYKIGITFLHYFNNMWDFDQTKENWETDLQYYLDE